MFCTGHPCLPERHDAATASFGNHNVVEHSDANEFSDFAKPIGHCDVFATGRRIARRVVVDQQHRRSAIADRCTENFARVD